LIFFYYLIKKLAARAGEDFGNLGLVPMGLHQIPFEIAC